MYLLRLLPLTKRSADGAEAAGITESWALCLQLPVQVRRKMIVGGGTSGYACISTCTCSDVTNPATEEGVSRVGEEREWVTNVGSILNYGNHSQRNSILFYSVYWFKLTLDITVSLSHLWRWLWAEVVSGSVLAQAGRFNWTEIQGNTHGRVFRTFWIFHTRPQT